LAPRPAQGRRPSLPRWTTCRRWVVPVLPVEAYVGGACSPEIKWQNRSITSIMHTYIHLLHISHRTTREGGLGGGGGGSWGADGDGDHKKDVSAARLT
jgi:hypothetical protein